MKAKVFLSTLSLITGAILAIWFAPPKEIVRVETRTETIEVEVETGTRKTTVTESPDGSRVTTVEETYRAERDRVATDETQVQIETPVQKNWGIDVRSDLKDQVTIGIQRRIIGEIFVGAYVGGNIDDLRNDYTYGVSIGFRF